MSVEYYLFVKKRYENIIKNLEEIINEHNFLFNETSKLDIDIAENILNEINLLYNKEYFSSKLRYFTILKNVWEKKIHRLCNHDFVHDYIDINPERCQKITYCKICEYTK